MEYEKFYGKLWKQGDSLIVTVPSNIVKYTGFKEGDMVVLMMKKKVDQEE